jgi:hypothetical protein
MGVVHSGINVISKAEVTVKLKPVNAEKPQLEHEYKVYKSLAGGLGIPSVCWFGTEGEYNAMVLEHLGPSLEDLFNHCNYKFGLKTVLILADQMVCTYQHGSHTELG